MGGFRGPRKILHLHFREHGDCVITWPGKGGSESREAQGTFTSLARPCTNGYEALLGTGWLTLLPHTDFSNRLRPCSLLEVVVLQQSPSWSLKTPSARVRCGEWLDVGCHYTGLVRADRQCRIYLHQLSSVWGGTIACLLGCISPAVP